MGAVSDVVRAKSTEFSFHSTKYPFVFLEKSMAAFMLNWLGIYSGRVELRAVSGEWVATSVQLGRVYKAKKALTPRP
jgi:hypothetical protein